MPKVSKTILIAIGISIAGIFGIFLLYMLVYLPNCRRSSFASQRCADDQDPSTQVDTAPSSWKTYRDNFYGFELKHPETVEVEEQEFQETKTKIFTLKWPRNSEEQKGAFMNPDVHVRYYDTVQNSDPDVVNFLISRCDADGPNGSDSCEKPTLSNIETNINQNGVYYSIFYTKLIQEIRSPQSKSESDIGPFIYAHVPTGAELTNYLAFFPESPTQQYPITFKDDMLKIVNSLKLLNTQ